MAVQLANPLITVNNDPVAVTPNTVMYTEGLGEQTLRAASLGGGQVEPIYAENIESNFSAVSFEMPSTIPNIAKARQWKANGDQNVVTITGTTPDGTLTRTFQRAAILNNYPVNLGNETNVPIEFSSQQAI